MQGLKILLMVCFLSPVYGAERSVEDSLDITSTVYKQLIELKKLKPKEYVFKIDDFRSSIEKFIEHKKQVCHGVFSSVVLNRKGLNIEAQKENGPKKYKLSREERKLCYREMKAIEITLVNHMFIARRKYLLYLHENQVKDLEDSRETILKHLHKTFNRGL